MSVLEPIKSTSQSSFTQIDLSKSSTRSKKQYIHKQIQKLMQENLTNDKIISQILHNYPEHFSKEQIELEIQRQQKQRSQLSGASFSVAPPKSAIQQPDIEKLQEELKIKPINVIKVENSVSIIQSAEQKEEKPQIVEKLPKPRRPSTPTPKPPKNPITNYIKTSESSLKNQVNTLTQQVADLKAANQVLTTQLTEHRTTSSIQFQLNKLKLALKIHETEVAQIEQIYLQSKADERFKTANGMSTLYELGLQRQLDEIEQQLREFDDALDNQKRPSRFALILKQHELIAQRIAILREIENQSARAEQMIMYHRVFTNLKQKSMFGPFNLPCFYPVSQFNDKHPLLSAADVKLPPNQPKFVLLRLIGEGGFSKVYKAYNLLTCDFVALKVSVVSAKSAEKMRLMLREAQLYSVIKHDHIVKLWSKPVIIEGGEETEISLEMELCDDQSLFDFICLQAHRIKSIKEKEQNERLLLSIFLQVADALKYLHEKNLTHNDISPSNILRKVAIWKLSDFSLVKEVDEKSQKVTTLGFTAPFASPEKFLNREFSLLSDIYSLGVVMFVAITGSIDLFTEIGKELSTKRMDAKVDTVETMRKVQESLQTTNTAVCTTSEDWVQLILMMIDFNPKQRPSAAAVVEALDKMLRKYVKRVKWEDKK